MKKVFVCLLCLLLLAGCTGQDAEETVNTYKTTSAYKIMNIYENEGRYSCLAVNWESERWELTFVGVNDAVISGWDGAELTSADLRPGMVIDVTWDGMVAESWPCQIRVDEVVVTKQDDDLVGLYRTVLNDLWENDSGLNQGAELLGLDFSTLTNLTNREKEALAYLFSCDAGLGLSYVTGTWEELRDQGYIDGENLVWENGVFFSVSMEQEGSGTFRFEAEKWRSGLGAIFFTDCTAKRGSDGAWSYESGGFAIS